MKSILEQIRGVTRKVLLIPPGESTFGGPPPVETLPGGRLPEVSPPSSALNPMPVGDQAAPATSPVPSTEPPEAAARRTARLAPRNEPVLTRARAASVPPRRQTRSGTQPGGTFRATYTAQLALTRSLHQPRDAGHCSPPRECVALRRHTLTSPPPPPETIRGGEQTEGPEHFQGGYPKRHDGGRRQTKISPASRSTASTSWCLCPPSLLDKRWLAHAGSTTSRRTTSSKVVWYCWDGRKYPGSTAAAPSHPSVDCKAFA